MAVRFSADGQGYSTSGGIPGTTYTVTTWVYLVVDRDDISSFWVHDQNGVDGHQIGTDIDGVTLQFASAGPTINGSALTVATWTRVAFVANSTTGTLYQGAAGSALTSTSGTIPAPTLNILTIGMFTGGTQWLNGRLANFKVHNAVLTQAEIEAELWSWAPVRTANLLRVHPFHGASTADNSGNGNTLTGGTGATTEPGPPIPPARGVSGPTARPRAANF